MSEWSGSGATERLHETIKEFNDVASTQTAQMIRLTRWLVVLTVVLCIGLVVQLVLGLS